MQYSAVMDVAHPISSVIPSLDGRVLEALAGVEAPLTLSRVHELAGTGSLSGVRRVLLRLVDTGLVDAVPGGYLLNREHLAAPWVVGLSQLRSKLVEVIATEVGAWRPRPVLVCLVGSAARADGDESSDIDLLIIERDGNSTGERVRLLAEGVERRTGNACHATVLGLSDLRRLARRREPVLAEWRRDLLPILGDTRVLHDRG
jgi:predicted nucleotidyltransferase